MGSRNINRISRAVWRDRAGPVWEMIAQGWRVDSRCPACGRAAPVDLVAVARKLGPGYVLWGRTPRCKRRPACPGRVLFSARPPGVVDAFPLVEPPGHG